MEDSERIEQILSSLGFHKIQDKGDYITCAIPNHNNPTGLSVLKENLYCNAFSTHMDFKGGIFDLIAYMNKYENFSDTMRWCHKILGLKYEYNGKKEEPKEDSILDFFKKYKTKPNKKTKEIELKKYTDEEIFGMYVRCPYANWIKEGITAKTQEQFSIGYHFDSKRVVIPHRHWKTGEIVGLIGRTICSDEEIEYFDIAKYFPIIPYKKGCNLYGLWENRQYIEEIKKEIIVFEAEKSVLKMASKGIRNCVSVGSHDLSDEQVKILLSLNVNEIVLAYDEDVPLEFMESEAKKFKGLRNISIMTNQYDILKDKQSPADATLKIFMALYKRRINYKYKAN